MMVCLQKKSQSTLQIITILFVLIVTIRRRLKAWGIAKQPRVLETAALCLKIVTMFYMNFLDSTIVRALNQEGHLISLWQIVQIQKDQGCKQRLRAQEQEEANSKL
jgi:hypothetical protein